MSYKHTNYEAKPLDANGQVAYTEEENSVWEALMARQCPIIQNRACPEFLDGVQMLNMPRNKVPQCDDISAVLQKATGWRLEPVPALISFDRFFSLLANRRFPAATFIRRKDELDYLKEPDIFHEVFGHCPLLTNPAYAEFVHNYGKLGVNANEKERILLARLFWFTIEFGLMNTIDGIRAYGGGILSSINETVYAVDSTLPQRKPFDLLEALRTSYRIDVIQPIYFVIDHFEQLYQLTEIDLMSFIHQAQNLDKDAPLHPC